MSFQTIILHMIRTILLSSPSERLAYFKQFDQTQHTWLVSNVRSKIELQQTILETHGYFEGDSVQRISEFWKTILARYFPEKKIIPDDLIEFLAEKWIEENPETQLKSSSRHLLTRACHQLSDLIFSEQDGVLLEWIEENPDVELHWLHWVEVCKKFIFSMVNEKNCLSSKWAAGFLLHAFANRHDVHVWDKEIFLDLGADLHSSEAQFFSRLSQHVKITVLKPRPPEAKFWGRLKTYDFLELTQDQMSSNEKNDSRFSEPNAFQIIHHETALGEIQYAVAQIRQWLQEKIAPEDILILFANYDMYWRKFSALCNLEGIPLDQSVKTKMIDLPLVQSWLSQCWTQFGLFEKEQTYHFLFSPEAQKISFDDYQKKYSLYEELSDLSNIPQLKPYAHFQINRASSRIFHQIMEQLFQCANHFQKPDDQKILSRCIQTIWQNLVEFPEQNLADYKKMIQKILSHTEIVANHTISTQSIQTSQIQSCQVHQGVKRIYLGLNQENFMMTPRIYKADETKLLSRDLNLFFEDDETSLAEFELYWQSHANFKQTLYSYCNSNFQGDLTAPHHFITELQYFQKINPKTPDLEAHPTVYSSLRGTDLSSEAASRALDRRQCDQGERRFQINTASNTLSLSATHLQNYKRCPFIYYSQKILKLKDLPEVDFDVDLLTEGVLIHALFESLLPHIHQDWPDEKIDQLLEDLRIKLKVDTFDQSVWDAAKKRYLRTAQRFLSFERQWAQKNTQNQIGELEKKFKLTVKDLLPEMEVLFQGTIDRIEIDSQNNILLVDYKRSTSAHKSPSSWVKDNLLQLLFYGWLVKRYELLEKKNLLGLVHYDYQRMNRKSSLLHENALQTLLHGTGNETDPVDDLTFQSFFDQIETEVRELVQKMAQNEFHPEPLDPNECPRCTWRGLCRAPHLNH